MTARPCLTHRIYRLRVLQQIAQDFWWIAHPIAENRYTWAGELFQGHGSSRRRHEESFEGAADVFACAPCPFIFGRDEPQTLGPFAAEGHTQTANGLKTERQHFLYSLL